MGRFFTGERFGRPQLTALFLLFVFLSQCAWLLTRRGPRLPLDQVSRIVAGRDQWAGKAIASTPQASADGVYDPDHSPLWYLVASAPNALFGRISPHDPLRLWGWLAALPFLVFGCLLGGSLWYVARRLYGNAGGYIALALYCFSPAIIQSSSLWFAQPETGAAWGAFGSVFTAIAVAHTLYAPREVVLWNWRRIVLLGLSFALSVGSQFSLSVVVPGALGFMLYLAPTRRLAALAIWGSAFVLALGLLLGSYFFHLQLFIAGLRHANYLPILWKAYAMPSAYHRVLLHLSEASPALLVAVPGALMIYATWRRARYFGNTAPLLVSLFFLLLGVGTPHVAGLGYQLMAIPFLFVFVAGIAADLLDSRYRRPAFAGLSGLLIANALWNLWALVQASTG